MQGGKNHTNMYDDQLTNRGTYGVVQVGGDLVTWPGSGDHRFHVGLMGGYAHQSTKTRSSDIGLTSKGKLSGYSAGFYATYMNDKPEATGPYADLWMIYQHFTDKSTRAVRPKKSITRKAGPGHSKPATRLG